MSMIDGKKGTHWKVMHPSTTRVSEGKTLDAPGSHGWVNRANLGLDGRNNDPRIRPPSEKFETNAIASRKEY